MDQIDHIKIVHDLFYVFIRGGKIKQKTTTADAVFSQSKKKLCYFYFYLLSDKTSYASAINLNFSSA